MRELNIIFAEPNPVMRKDLSFFFSAASIVNKMCVLKSIQEVRIEKKSNINLIITDTESDEDFQHISKLRELNPKLHILILTSKERFFDNFLFAQKYNLPNFLTKRSKPKELLKEMEVIRKRVGFDELPYGKPKNNTFDSLFDSPPIFSMKELCILHLVAKAKTNAEIGDIVSVSPRTIETHRRRIIEKVEGRNIIPALVSAIRHKYISIDSN